MLREVFPEQGAELIGQLDCLDALRADEDAPEEHLVPVPPRQRVGLIAVGAGRVFEKLASKTEALFDFPEVGLGFPQVRLCGLELFGEVVLLLREHVERDRSRVLQVIRDELVALPLDVLDVATVASRLLLAVARRQPEQFDQPGLQFRHALCVELDFSEVVLGYEVIDPVRRQVRKVTRSFSVVTGTADEVVVLAAVAAGAFRELEAAATETAERHTPRAWIRLIRP